MVWKITKLHGMLTFTLLESSKNYTVLATADYPHPPRAKQAPFFSHQLIRSKEEQ
jgi:hypothetical protein